MIGFSVVKHKAVIFDRDGVLIKDVGNLTEIEEVCLYPKAPEAIKRLHDAGYILIVVSNQAVVARGWITERDVIQINQHIDALLRENCGINIDKYYFCPHHPDATIPEYRVDCECRKPKPGMLLRAAKEFTFDLNKCYMIGDRISDIIAGYNAGCMTIQVQTGMHDAEPIQSDAIDLSIEPDFVCCDLSQAVEMILIDN